MSFKVGIPRVLFYYYYYPLWKGFLESLGCQVVVSDKTNKKILDDGVEIAVDEACLPIKVAFGHVLNLAKKDVDFIFLPRLVSVAKREYTCPKFLGFPDMVKQNIGGLPPVIDVTVNMHKNPNDLKGVYKQIGRMFTNNVYKIWQAQLNGQKALYHYRQLLLQGYRPEEAFAILERGQKTLEKKEAGSLKIALIGHPYNIYDQYISMNIIKKLKAMGAQVVTPEQLSDEIIRRETEKLPKKLFWTMGQRTIGAAYHYATADDIDGMIHLTAFACGLDSMTGELIERFNRRTGHLPFLNLTIDEHTGEAGVITRIEAFLDMVRWKKSKQEFLLGSGA